MTSSIGYRKPPEQSRFKKGVSGNPKGRPKGTRNFVTLLDAELGQKIVVNENGRRKTVTRMQAMVKRLVANSLQGELKSLLALVEILRKTGGLETGEVANLLPDNYEDILESFVQSRVKSPAKKSA